MQPQPLLRYVMAWPDLLLTIHGPLFGRILPWYAKPLGIEEAPPKMGGLPDVREHVSEYTSANTCWATRPVVWLCDFVARA